MMSSKANLIIAFTIGAFISAALLGFVAVALTLSIRSAPREAVLVPAVAAG